MSPGLGNQQFLDFETAGEQLELIIEESSSTEENASGQQLAVIGLVTDRDLVRTWSASGSQDWLVTEADELRALLGGGRVDREPMLPPASPEMVITDDQARTILVSAPYQPEEGRLFPLAQPFEATPVQVTGLEWNQGSYEALAEWLTTVIEVAGYRGETVHIHERHQDDSGHRIVRVGYQEMDDVWAGFVGTNDWPQTKIWSDAEIEQHIALLYYEASESSSETLALLALEAVTRWPAGPLDLVLAWMPAADGARPRS